MTTATTEPSRSTRPVESTRWRSLGCEVALITRGAGATRHTRAVGRMRVELDAVDLAASRFRPDSELTRVNARPDRWHPVSGLFLDLVEDSLDAARLTGGLVTPTLGRSLALLGYDRDLALLPVCSAPFPGPAVRALPTDRPPTDSWRRIRIDRPARGADGLIRIPEGVALDLGSIGKAAAADRIAALLGDDELNRCGGLVNLGGDLAVVRPRGAAESATTLRWEISVDESGRERVVPPRTSVGIVGGGLATSSTAVRVWSRNSVRRHHIVDPRTGLPAQPYWRCATVHAADCRAANAASTAAIVLGAAAPDWLDAHGFAARLVGGDDLLGSVARPAGPVLVGGWPVDVRPADVRPADVRPADVRPADHCPIEVGSEPVAVTSAASCVRPSVVAGAGRSA